MSEFPEIPPEFLPKGVGPATWDPVVLRAAAEAYCRHPWDHDMDVKAYLVLALLADRAALATLARAAEEMESTFELASHPESPLGRLREALALPAVRDVLTTDRAGTHSHAARDSGEGDE